MVSKNKRISWGLPVFLFSLYGLSHGIIVIWDAMHQKRMQKHFKSLFCWGFFPLSSIYRINSTLEQSFANLSQEIISIAFSVFDKN